MVKPTQTQSDERLRKRYSITFSCAENGTINHVVSAASVREAFERCERAYPENKLLFVGAFDIAASRPVTLSHVAEQSTVPEPKLKSLEKPAKLKKGRRA